MVPDFLPGHLFRVPVGPPEADDPVSLLPAILLRGDATLDRIPELIGPFLGQRTVAAEPPSVLFIGTFLVAWSDAGGPRFETGELETVTPGDPEMPYLRELLALVGRKSDDAFSERTATLLRTTRILPRASAPQEPVVLAKSGGFVVSPHHRVCICVADRMDYVLDDADLLRDARFEVPEAGVLVSRVPAVILVVRPVPVARLSDILGRYPSAAVVVPPSTPEIAVLVRACDRSVRRVSPPAIFELAVRLPTVLEALTYCRGMR